LRRDSESLAEFDDDTLQYLANSLEGRDDDGEMLEAWIPMFCAHNGHLEEESARNVGLRVLKRLTSTGSTGCITTASANDFGDVNQNNSVQAVPYTPLKSAKTSSSAADDVRGLREWLIGLSLEQYHAQALEWCNQIGAAHLSKIKEEWEDFAEWLPLKSLEKKRLEKVIRGALTSPQKPQPGVEEGPLKKPMEDESPDKENMPARWQQFRGNNANLYRYDPKPLERGMSGTVHRCVRIKSAEGKLDEEKEHAVKILKTHGGNGNKETIQREIQILFRLRHDNVVALHDVGTEDNNKIHLVMDLIKGCSLMDQIPVGKGMPEREARHVFLQLVYALGYIHKQNVVHRDLKPENIMVDLKASRGRFLTVKIIDFGLSKSLNNGYTVAHSRLGTPAYWAPEVAAPSRQGGYDFSVDLWSLGITLYVMLEGMVPFQGGESMKAEFEFSEDTSGRRRPISAAARDLIQKLAMVNPKERISLEECLNHSWANGKGVMHWFVQLALKGSQEDAGKVEKFLVPGESCLGYKQLRSELADFSQRNTCSAEARRGAQHEVVVTWGRTVTEAQLQESQKALSLLLERHFPRDGNHTISSHGELTNPTTPTTGSKDDSPPTRMFSAAPLYRQHQSLKLERTLKVREDYGAGLDLIPVDTKGMLVHEVLAFPGQIGLQRGDIIYKIAQVSLMLNCPDEIRKTFGQYLKDGVEIKIRRESTGHVHRARLNTLSSAS
jgi:serine/threonine protein kinase